MINIMIHLQYIVGLQYNMFVLFHIGYMSGSLLLRLYILHMLNLLLYTVDLLNNNIVLFHIAYMLGSLSLHWYMIDHRR